MFARTNGVREEYSSNVTCALTLFDELRRMGLGDVDAYARAYAMALRWLLRVPMADDAWSGYFEDVDLHTDPTTNPNQYSALSVARWLMSHPEVDPLWREHVAHLLSWTAEKFGGDTPRERGLQWGATVMSEQHDDTAKMAQPHGSLRGHDGALVRGHGRRRRARERRALAELGHVCVSR